MNSSSFKIALLQSSYPGSYKKAREKSKKMIEEAALKGAELVVLKELHIREYFCQSENVEFFEYAKSFKEDVEFFSRVAKESGVVLVTSLFERRASGIYHNTAVVFEKDGSEAGRYRKMHIPDDPGFYEKFYFTPGDMGFEPIDTSVGKLGVLICWDQWYPEAARLMALAGAEILIYPTAIGWFMSENPNERERQLEAWKAVQRGHAVANGAYVVAVNRVGFEKDSSGVMEGVQFWG
ncbi:MAG: nitrilase-related carbon-nitrogen hydrolase, partial [Campylobacterales bacterium]